MIYIVKYLAFVCLIATLFLILQSVDLGSARSIMEAVGMSPKMDTPTLRVQLGSFYVLTFFRINFLSSLNSNLLSQTGC